MYFQDEKVLLKDSGDIEYAECGCPAGLGPKGSCKHIASVGYALEEYSRIRSIHDHPVSSTSLLQTWNQPRKKHLDSTEVNLSS